MVQRLAVVLDQHVLVIAANTHTPPSMMGRNTHIHIVTETPVHVYEHTQTHTREVEKEKISM